MLRKMNYNIVYENQSKSSEKLNACSTSKNPPCILSYSPESITRALRSTFMCIVINNIITIYNNTGIE